MEYDADLYPPLVSLLRPAGLVPQVGAAVRPADLARHRQRIARWMQLLMPISDNETRRTASWTHYLLTHYACRRGLKEMARFHHRYLRQLIPQDRQMLALVRRCGL